MRCCAQVLRPKPGSNEEFNAHFFTLVSQGAQPHAHVCEAARARVCEAARARPPNWPPFPCAAWHACAPMRWPSLAPSAAGVCAFPCAVQRARMTCWLLVLACRHAGNVLLDQTTALPRRSGAYIHTYTLTLSGRRGAAVALALLLVARLHSHASTPTPPLHLWHH